MCGTSPPPALGMDGMPVNDVLYVVAVGLALASVLLVSGAILALKRRRWLASLGRAGTAALLLSLAALSAMLGVSTQGYRALTHEELAATITTVPTGPAAFQAFVEFPDGRTTSVPVTGDQLVVDAHILKWLPIANLVGLHTHYELDRLAGRYVNVDDERIRPRTIHTLKADKSLDFFHLAQRHTLLTLLVDAEYGSATYVEVKRPARFEVRVSPTGLLIREVAVWTAETATHLSSH